MTSGLILLGAISSIPSNQKAFAEEFTLENPDTVFIPHYNSKKNTPSYSMGTIFFIEKSKTHVRMREEIAGWRSEPITCKRQIVKGYKKSFKACYEKKGGSALSGQFKLTPAELENRVGPGLKSLTGYWKLKKKGKLYNTYP
tara:strand:- start:127 stop:552 length:426 start_codon:yes stop_codon:yes gene_type:complete